MPHLSRFIASMAAAAFTALLLGACDSGVEDEIRLKKLAQDCLVNSDCAKPFVCAFEVCHEECKTSRDCGGEVRCLATENPYRVCQLESERACATDRDCKTGLRCGVDGECRDACQTSTQCIPGQLCVSGTCADPDELDSSGQLAPRDGVTPGAEGRACTYASDCSGGLLCRNQTCLPECKVDQDCRAGQQCLASRCQSDGDGKACFYNSDCETERGESCRGGTCLCACVTDVDCPAWHECDDCACVPAPDAPVLCRYNSDCEELGKLCIGGVCDCECKKDVDCSDGKTCNDCLCVTERCEPACGDDQVCKNGSCQALCGDLTRCDAQCVDVETDPRYCGDCATSCGPGQSCRAGECRDFALPKSCWELHLSEPTLPSGTYLIDPDGSDRGADKLATYCDMSNDGGGWTLVLKADGAKPTFNFTRSIWNDATTLNPDSADLSPNEAKLDSYSRVPAGEVRLETVAGDVRGSLVLQVGEPSLFQAVRRRIAGSRETLVTTAGRSSWEQLFPGHALLGEGCNLEGIDAEALQPDESLRIGVRLGILSSTGNDCSAPDSYFGIGGEVAANSTCSTAPGPSVGGVTACGDGGTFSAFGYVFVRELPRSCREVLLRHPGASTGSYRLDVDGPGPLAPFDAHCDMTYDGGGWTLFFVQQAATGSAEGVPAPGGNAYLPSAIALELGQLSQQVHFRNAGQPNESITSIAGDYPIQNLRRGSVLNVGSRMTSPSSTVTGWTGPRAIVDYLWQGCREDELAGRYPALYQACNNPEGLSVDAGHAGWGYLADTDFEAYLR